MDPLHIRYHYELCKQKINNLHALLSYTNGTSIYLFHYDSTDQEKEPGWVYNMDSRHPQRQKQGGKGAT